MVKCDQESEYDMNSKFGSWHLTAVNYEMLELHPEKKVIGTVDL